jgi:hypothetical protein
MAKGTKTDNHNPLGKLALRRYFLERYHGDGSATVFDCCQGGGLMWTELRKSIKVASYWGVDLKRKKGRLSIDSVRILEQGVSQNVIDVDSYGSPWKHWREILPRLQGPTTVFLTIGSTMHRGATDDAVLEILGCKFRNHSIPASFRGRLDDIGVNAALSWGERYAILHEVVEAISDGNARYIGVHIRPKKEAGSCELPAKTSSAERS